MQSFNILCKAYSYFFGISYEKSKKSFRLWLKIATCVFLARSFYHLLIEECVFLNSRENEVIGTISRIENALWSIKQLNCYDDIGNRMINIIQTPVSIPHQ